jgi:acetone carboxylase alpha subunit
VTSEHSSRVYDNAGLCGGYPAPSCQKHRSVRKTNIDEVVAKRQPIPHGIGTDPERSELERTIEGDHETAEGPYITAPHQAGDMFTHAYNGGGGYGDVLERDPAKVAHDVENGFVTATAAEDVFGVVLSENAADRLEVDAKATLKRRAKMRQKRRKRAIPVSEWMAKEAKRVKSKKLAPEVRLMYGAAMRLSPRFADEFRTFWSLGSDFTFEAKETRK